MSSNLKHTETSVSQISIDSLCLQHAQMPRTQDLAIFVPTTTTRDGQSDHLTPCACVQGKKLQTIVCVALLSVYLIAFVYTEVRMISC